MQATFVIGRLGTGDDEESPRATSFSEGDRNLKTTPMKLITIVGEEVLKETLVRHVIDLGAKGATYHTVDGTGFRTEQHDDVFGENFEMKVICNEEVAAKILEAVAEEYFDRYAVIAWESDIRVVNGELY
jgi:nitrogen regulatory protein P-II 2